VPDVGRDHWNEDGMRDDEETSRFLRGGVEVLTMVVGSFRLTFRFAKETGRRPAEWFENS